MLINAESQIVAVVPHTVCRSSYGAWFSERCSFCGKSFTSRD